MKGQSNLNWRFQTLLRTMQTLAAEPEVALRAYSPRIDAVKDLANDFISALFHVAEVAQEGLLTEALTASVCSV